MESNRKETTHERQHKPPDESTASMPSQFGNSRADRLKQLRAFCHVARLGSITQAAERIFSSQPAVSLQMRALEEDINVALLERNGPHIALTAAGREFYRLVEPLVEDVDRLPETFAEQYHGVAAGLSLAAGETAATAVLPRFLEQFWQQHPGTRVNVMTGTGRQCLNWLRAYEVDLVVAAMDVEPADLEFSPILSSDYVVITPEDHALAGRTSVKLQELSPHPLILHTTGTYTRQFAEMYMRQHGLSRRVAVEVDGWSAIRDCVEAGLGIAVVPELCLSESDRVWRIPLNDLVRPRIYGAITRRDRSVPAPVRQLIRIMAPPFPIEA